MTVATPFVGQQLSFTPAITGGRDSQGSAAAAAPSSANWHHHMPASTVSHFLASQPAFSTTPSVAVPLSFALSNERAGSGAFQTPAAAGARSSYVAQNPLFALTGVGDGGSASKRVTAAVGVPGFQHLPSFGAHAALPASLGMGSAAAEASLPPLPSAVINIPHDPLRRLVKSCLERGHVSGAMFYADALATLSSFSPETVYSLADAFARAGHHARATHLLKKHSLLRLPLDATSPAAQLHFQALYLGTQCLVESRQNEEALQASLPEDPESWEVEPQWLVETDNLLRRVVNSGSAESKSDTDDTGAVAAAYEAREIFGKGECALLASLAAYHLTRAQGTQDRGEDPLEGEISLAASIAFLRGHLYELQSQKYHAILWYKLALQFDLRLVESFERLTSKRLLTAREELAFLQSLSFPEDLLWLKYMWLNRIDVERIDDQHEGKAEGQYGGLGRGIRGDGLAAPATVNLQPSPSTAVTITSPSGSSKPSSSSSPLLSSSVSSLFYRYRLLSHTYQFSASSPALLVGLIEYKYKLGSYKEAYDLAVRVMKQDPYALEMIPTYICTLVELKLTSELFHLSHKLVESYPTGALSWFSVGAYYFLLRKLDLARRFFYKSTRMDAFFAPGWIGFGHTFSFTDESDQALLAYRTAHRLFEGSHLPLVCMGMEYLKTNNYSLASQFLLSSSVANPDDPLAWNELGCVEYKCGHYSRAVHFLLECLQRVKQEVLENWEPVLFNLGHAYRKMEKYAEAITAYNRALSVSTRPCTILTAIGFTYHLQGEFNSAIDCYHKALGLNPRDTFTIDMLDRALTEVMTF